MPLSLIVNSIDEFTPKNRIKKTVSMRPLQTDFVGDRICCLILTKRRIYSKIRYMRFQEKEMNFRRNTTIEKHATRILSKSSN